MASVVIRRINGPSEEALKWSGGTFDAVLPVTLRPLIVRPLFFLLFSLTLCVGVLIFCDWRLRIKPGNFIQKQNAEPCVSRMNCLKGSRSHSVSQNTSTRYAKDASNGIGVHPPSGGCNPVATTPRACIARSMIRMWQFPHRSRVRETAPCVIPKRPCDSLASRQGIHKGNRGFIACGRPANPHPATATLLAIPWLLVSPLPVYWTDHSNPDLSPGPAADHFSDAHLQTVSGNQLMQMSTRIIPLSIPTHGTFSYSSNYSNKATNC